MGNATSATSTTTSDTHIAFPITYVPDATAASHATEIGENAVVEVQLAGYRCLRAQGHVKGAFRAILAGAGLLVACLHHLADQAVLEPVLQ